MDKHPEQVLLLAIWSIIMIINRNESEFTLWALTDGANKRKGFNSSTVNNWNKCSKKLDTCQPK
jgi:hypothetical protein